ncbi:MAG: TIGR01459 family HAD-type hydrolase [Alphaproteobacteria bacterium]
MNSTSTKFLDTCSGLIEAYDYFILDLWGVVHNGKQPYAGALDFMAAVQKTEGKTLTLLSNAPRRVASVEDTLSNRIGVARDLYDFVMTSGEDAFQHLENRPDPFYKSLGRKAWLLGALPNDQSMVEGYTCDIEFVESAFEADFILNTGPSGPEPKVEDWDNEIQDWLKRDVPMICANPDRVVHFGDQLHLCAGGVAERFENKGGLVRWHGKPFAGVYETVFDKLALKDTFFDKQKALMVGDSFITDVAGANSAGIDSVLISGGIYRDRIEQEGIEPLVAETGERPTYVIDGLKI